MIGFTNHMRYKHPNQVEPEVLERLLIKPVPTQAASSSEAVKHPSHYGGGANPYEAIKVIQAWNLDFELGNVLKYIYRAPHKGTLLTDLYKAKQYLQFEIEKQERKLNGADVTA